MSECAKIDTHRQAVCPFITFFSTYLYRDCKIGQIYEGTSNIQLQTIAKIVQKSFESGSGL